MIKKWPIAMAFLAVLVALGWNVWNAGIASGFIDPVTRLGAQDEALYTREAIHWATQGGWLTPVFLDRYVLFKPPLLMWLSALSMKIFGIGPLAARLPALLAGALVCAIAFSIVSKARTWTAAVAALLLLVSNQLFHTLARLNMTDMLLAAAVASAFAFLIRDPSLESRAAFWGFAGSVASAILTKSVAGLLPLFSLGLYWLAYRGGGRPRFRRIALVALAALSIALPWHMYQLIARTHWFFAEYFGVQLVVFGSKPPQTSQENQVWFYLLRLGRGDPVLSLLALTAIPGLLAALRRASDPLPVVLASWLTIFGCAMVGFQYRSAQYLVPLIPAVAIMAAIYSPVFRERRAIVPLALLCAAMVVKVRFPDRPWGLAYRGGTTLSSADPLTNYCDKKRPTDLIVFSPDDEFYSSVLPLARVRYSWLDGADREFREEPHLHYLGITLTPDEFKRLPVNSGLYRERLRQWALDSDRPIGTAIVARSRQEMQRVMAAHPDSDFYAPKELMHNLDATVLQSHDLMLATPDRVFLLAKRPSGEEKPPEIPGWACDAGE